MSSTVTSAKPRCNAGSNADSDISPERMKHVVTAAHSIKASVS